MTTILIFIHVIVSLLLIVSILLQSSKGGGLAGMFGGGGGMGAVFGGRGAASFLAKLTLWLGVSFAVTSITIALLSAGSPRQQSMVEQVLEQEQQQATPSTILPAAPGSAEQPEQGEPQNP